MCQIEKSKYEIRKSYGKSVIKKYANGSKPFRLRSWTGFKPVNLINVLRVVHGKFDLTAGTFFNPHFYTSFLIILLKNSIAPFTSLSFGCPFAIPPTNLKGPNVSKPLHP